MIGSLRALAVLAVVAIAAVVLAVVAPRPQIGVVDRRIATALDAASIRTLRWEHGGVSDIEVVREADRWRFAKGQAADAAVVDDVIAALRGGVWQRREPAARAGKVHARVTAIGSTTVSFGIGDALAGTEQVWLVAGDDALLVDGWIAHALDRTALSLRVREPFAHVADADSIVVTDVLHPPGARIAGHPRRIDGVLVDATLVHRFEAALASVTVVDVEPQRIGTQSTIAIAIGPPVNIDATDAGPRACGEWLAGLDACVMGWDVAGPVAMEMRKPIAEIAERRPAPIDAVTIQLVDGTLELAKRPSIDGHDADPARVAELLAALATPADVTAAPATKPTGTITIRDKTTTLELELHDGIVVRRGEPLGLRLAPAAWAALTRPATAYRDTALWLEEPTAIIAITVDRVTYKSGNIVGTWTREPPGTVDPRALDNATQILAAPRAPAATLPAGFTPQHTISILVAAPSGPAVTHVLEIGAGCVAKADGTAVTLPGPVCTLARLGT